MRNDNRKKKWSRYGIVRYSIPSPAIKYALQGVTNVTSVSSWSSLSVDLYT